MNKHFALSLIAALIAVTGFTSTASAQCEIVDAYSQDTYEQVYTRGVPVELWIDGDGDTDLDLFVYDENGNLIDSDEDGTDICVVTWTPRWTGKFRIVVKNFGDVYNEYRIWTE